MEHTDAPREVLIHQSANRPNLILGGDRELVLVAIMIAFAVAFSLAAWWGVAVSAAFWVGSMAALQRMGKADPLLRHVYLRHVRYAAYYPAKSRCHLRSIGTPMNWR